jgi:hypothetical protein
MTAPAAAPSYDPRPDPQVTYLLDGVPIGEYDRHGSWWIVRTTKGWHQRPGFRNQRANAPAGHGAHEGENWAEPRLISINVTVVCPSVAARLDSIDLINAAASDPGRRYELRVTDQIGRVRTALVKRDGKGEGPTVRNEHLFDMQLELAAPDPRKHDGHWQGPVCRPPAPTPGGLSFPLDFGGGGRDFGTPLGDSTVAAVKNDGTAPAGPLLVLEGPLTTPAVLHREPGRALRYGADLEAGERLSINCDDAPQGGTPPHTAISSIRGNVTTLLTREGRDWPTVDPGQVATFTLRGFGDQTASLTPWTRSAWW